MVRDVIHPVHPQGRPATESPRRQAEPLESDDDD